MKKYLALYMAPIASFEKAMKTPPEDMKQSMERWRAWMKENKDAIVDGGAPLGKVKRVNKNGIVDVRNLIGGYTIVQAQSHDAAAKRFEDNPHITDMEDGSIEVMEFVTMPNGNS